MSKILVVGAGLCGAICAYELKKRGNDCLVIEKRKTLAGNLYTEKIENIMVHMYGPHIFHTSNKMIWEYVNQFAVFKEYVNSPIANYNGETYNLPFNMNTFVKLWPDAITPDVARNHIEREKELYHIMDPKNLEEQSISMVGRTIYEKLIKGYTEKQWGKLCVELPPSIIKRLPVRFTYDNNYFDDTYQGIPLEGYTKMIQTLLDGIEVELDCDFFSNKDYYLKNFDNIIYTGPIDVFFEYCYGELEYRSLRFDIQVIDIPQYQETAVVNYTDKKTPYTRIIEHKHFLGENTLKTVITREYSTSCDRYCEPYYPINDKRNSDIYLKYKKMADLIPNIIFTGRLGLYKYMDMDDIVEESLRVVNFIDGHKEGLL